MSVKYKGIGTYNIAAQHDGQQFVGYNSKLEGWKIQVYIS